MSREIKFGYWYKNKWGDIRVPIDFDMGNVIFIEKRMQQPFLYNPYTCRVSKTAFLKSFELQKVPYLFSESDLKEIGKITVKKDEEWQELLKGGAAEIFNILNEERNLQ